MKKEYDFSKGRRGLFHKAGATLNVPVYLDKDNRDFVATLAEKQQIDVATLVNKLVRSHIPAPPPAPDTEPLAYRRRPALLTGV